MQTMADMPEHGSLDAPLAASRWPRGTPHMISAMLASAAMASVLLLAPTAAARADDEIRIGNTILYQDDDFGKDYVKGLKDGLAGRIPVIAEASYKITDPDIDGQLAALQASGADIFFDVTTPKFAAMSIRRTAEMGWKPEHIISTVSESVAAVMQPAGLQNAEGVLSAGYYLEGDDRAAAGDPAYRDWSAFMDRYAAY